MIALLCYHKNAEKLYLQKWIEQYKESIVYQTYNKFDIIECNYGGEDYRVFEESNFDKIPSNNFVETLNRLLDKCFFELGYEYVFNSNLDDFFSIQRIERQLLDFQKGYDIVSSNFCLLKNERIFKYHLFHNLDIAKELGNGHNVIAHPCVGYSKRFWGENRYVPSEQPCEDLLLWQRAIKNGMKFFINDQNLLFHRIHNNAVCQSENR